MNIIDRRLNPGSKSLENRQRFLRRAKTLVRDAVKKSSESRDIKDVLEGGEVSIPLDGMHEPRLRREGGIRDMVLPGNKKFVEGDVLPVRDKAAGSLANRGKATAKTLSASSSAGTSSSISSSMTSNFRTSPSERWLKRSSTPSVAPAIRSPDRRPTSRSAARCGWPWRAG